MNKLQSNCEVENEMCRVKSRREDFIEFVGDICPWWVIDMEAGDTCEKLLAKLKLHESSADQTKTERRQSIAIVQLTK
jgi:hypothetical protein